jgi:lysyl-tRNA synthetase class 1
VDRLTVLDLQGVVSVADATDWASQLADEVLTDLDGRGETRTITVASGISPSGPVHLGNLREVMVQHFVADEIRRRGREVRHILSWDDYDRFRKVPAGVPESFAEHVGRPLTAVPDFCGGHDNYAEHFKAPLREALAELHVDLVEISQTAMYTSGAYAEQVRTAMLRRVDIDEVLGRYRTKAPADDDVRAGQDAAYYPFTVYCEACGRDHTQVTGYDDATGELSYRSRCGHSASGRPLSEVPGKLAWKVDWPMRWAFEQVDFESAGVDHSTPGSSFTVGSELVREIFQAPPPHYVGYSFVGTTDSAKMSSSAGSVPTPSDALRVLEAPIARWLYGRRRPGQSFTVAFGQELTRLYDEWDAALIRREAGTADPAVDLSLTRALSTAAGELEQPARRLPFRTLASVIDVAAGDAGQILRIARDLTPDRPVDDLAELQPRLSRAQAWIAEHVPPEERTQVRDAANDELLSGLDEQQRAAVSTLLARLDDQWSLDGLTDLLYGIPKQQLGLPVDVAPTPELKVAQRQWFSLLYRLLTHRDTGPRLPTLLLAIGADRVRALLGPALTTAARPSAAQSG